MKKKEMSSNQLNKKTDGHQPIHTVRCKQASESETSQIERALDRLLINLIKQDRAQRSQSS